MCDNLIGRVWHMLDARSISILNMVRRGVRGIASVQR